MVFAIAFFIIIMFTGNININSNDNSLTIEATFWENITLNYSDIASIEYSESNDPGQRLNGFGSSRLMLGWFSSDADGKHTRYTYTSCKSAIIITTKDGKKLIVNRSNDTQTKELYEQILPRLVISEDAK